LRTKIFGERCVSTDRMLTSYMREDEDVDEEVIVQMVFISTF
jgi:hypothetical protein